MDRNEEIFKVSSMFRALLKNISQEWNKSSAGKYNLSFPQFQVLYVLKLRGPLKVSELAEALSLTPPAITGLTDKLVAEGYLQKERAEDDRRVVNITLLEPGLDVIRKVKKDQKEMIQGFFNFLAEEDIRHLRRIFSLMLSNLDKDNHNKG
ncbi:MarR family winged helix-turn-helix transcriptional regulator [Paenibacillus sp. NPDC058910]|uniref:MarR family winged helix-turn-helix transcriptional regulator n=1 Tax=unclassified Paenibacillus TaxID=185978 RepID=UPI0036A81929